MAQDMGINCAHRFRKAGSDEIFFGLIHGFGLATRLQQLPLGKDGLLMRILAFNVGVELGQVMALSALLLLLAGWRRMESFRRWGALANGLLIAAGLLLFQMQMHGYSHASNLGAFPFDEETHFHVHEEMTEERPTSILRISLRAWAKFRPSGRLSRIPEWPGIAPSTA